MPQPDSGAPYPGGGGMPYPSQPGEIGFGVC